MTIDYSLTAGADGKPLLHRIDCPMVEQMRQAGEPVMTMLDCRGEPAADIPRHDCLKATTEIKS